MSFCRYCGRKLAEGEVCHCRDKIQPGNTDRGSEAGSVGNGKGTAAGQYAGYDYGSSQSPDEEYGTAYESAPSYDNGSNYGGGQSYDNGANYVASQSYDNGSNYDDDQSYDNGSGYDDGQNYDNGANYASSQSYNNGPNYDGGQGYDNGSNYDRGQNYNDGLNYAGASNQDSGWDANRADSTGGYADMGRNSYYGGPAPSFSGNGSSNGAGFREYWVAFKNRVGLGEPETNDVNYYERGLEIVPQCIEKDEGEVPIKQYNAAILRTRLKFARAEGRLQVTNKRVIFRATGRSFAGRTTLQQEFAIDEISGLKITKNHRFSFMNFLGTFFLLWLLTIASLYLVEQGAPRSVALLIILNIFLGILTWVPFFVLYKKFWIKFMSLSLGCGFMFTAFTAMGARSRVGAFFGGILLIIHFVLLVIDALILWLLPNLIIAVETTGESSAIYIRRDENGLFTKDIKDQFTGATEVMPWADTEVMIIELWAMISDIKKYGDAAIDMWRPQG